MIPHMALITTAEFARRTGICTKTAYNLAVRGTIRAVPVGGGAVRTQWLIHDGEVTSDRFRNRPRPGFPKGRKKTRKAPSEKI